MIVYKGTHFQGMSFTKLSVKKYLKLINNFIILAGNVSEDIQQVYSNVRRDSG